MRHANNRETKKSSNYSIKPSRSLSARSSHPARVSPVPGDFGGVIGIDMHRGYFKVWRKLEDSPVYYDTPAFRVFFDLLIRANWRECRKVLFRGEQISLYPGQLTIGRHELSSRIDLSPSSTYRALKKLKDLYKIIDVKSDSKWTLVTILNWDRYQNGYVDSEQQPDSMRTATGQQPDTLKEYKHLNIKRIKEKKESFSNDFFKNRFWPAYPKKRSKEDARKALLSIKPEPELQEKIITALEKAKKTEGWKKDDGKFIPYPATWLRSHGWEDEIIETENDRTMALAKRLGVKI